MTDPSNTSLLEAFEDLRVADVRDGMDTMLLHHKGSCSPGIRPLWRTRTFGIAKTVRYTPYGGTVPRLSPKEYWDWVSWYYQNICPYPWIDEIAEGEIIMIDQCGIDAGLMGSENSMTVLRNGGRGCVSNGGVRDTDEVILQKVPFWSASISQKMVQGRLQYESHNQTIEIGGVTVNPGDVVVADGDGVIVVPRNIALDVARYAREEHERDKVTRRDHYNALGLAPDETVQSRDE